MNKKLISLFVLCLLAACSKQQALDASPVAKAGAAEVQAPNADTSRMMELLRAVYGAETAHDNYLLVELPDPDKREASGSYRLEPVAMHELADGRVALVANAQVADDEGRAMSAHASSGLLSAYLLRRVDGQWKVEARHENIASLGSFGQFGEVEWVALSEGKPGFTVQHGGTWQGYSIGLLSVFDLNDGAMHDLAGGVALFSDDEGACDDEKSSCWSTKGKWKFEKRPGAAYDDLVIRFKGHEESRPEGAPETQARVRKEQAGMARYKFDGRAYVLIEGENIVRGI